jgi:hypothetical protein
MAKQENVRVVQQVFEALGRGDIPAMLNALIEDVDWHNPESTEILPWAGTCHGREQVAQFFTTLGEVVEIQQFEPQEFIAQGDKVVVLGYDRARVKSTGRTYENHWAMIFTLRGDKIAGFRIYEDTAAILAAYRGA